MALTGTTLANAIDALTLDINVTSSAGATVGGFCRIDGEFSVIVAINGNKLSLRSRGDNGGLSVAHAAFAPVTFGVAADQASLGASEGQPVPVDENHASIGADGPIPLPLRNTLYTITKGAALATSALPNPPLSSDGLEVGFISLTLFAHVITVANATNGTAGNKTTLTFPAFAGAGVRLKALRGQWVVLYTTGAVVAS